MTLKKFKDIREMHIASMYPARPFLDVDLITEWGKKERIKDVMVVRNEDVLVKFASTGLMSSRIIFKESVSCEYDEDFLTLTCRKED